MGSCPGGTLSNFWCWFFGSDLELSIAMTTASSILSFAFLTINCLIYMPLVSDEGVKIDYISLGISVSSLICGVIFGLFVAYKTKPTIVHTSLQSFCVRIQIKKTLIIIGGISMMVTLLLGAYSNTLVSSVPAYKLPFEIFIGGIILNLTSWTLTFILSYIICQLPNNQSITVCIECANQNVGLSIAIILLTMPLDEADIAVGIPMFYGVLNATVIFIFGSVCRMCGFIENHDDEINHKFANSGFSKLCGFLSFKCNRSKDDDGEDEGDAVENAKELTTRRGHHRQVSSRSTMTPDFRDTDTTLNTENIEMLMEEYESARTPSNEEIAVKQSLKQNEIHSSVNDHDAQSEVPQITAFPMPLTVDVVDNNINRHHNKQKSASSSPPPPRISIDSRHSHSLTHSHSLSHSHKLGVAGYVAHTNKKQTKKHVHSKDGSVSDRQRDPAAMPLTADDEGVELHIISTTS